MLDEVFQEGDYVLELEDQRNAREFCMWGIVTSVEDGRVWVHWQNGYMVGERPSEIRLDPNPCEIPL